MACQGRCAPLFRFGLALPPHSTPRDLTPRRSPSERNGTDTPRIPATEIGRGSCRLTDWSSSGSVEESFPAAPQERPAERSSAERSRRILVIRSGLRIRRGRSVQRRYWCCPKIQRAPGQRQCNPILHGRETVRITALRSASAATTFPATPVGGDLWPLSIISYRRLPAARKLRT